MQSDPRLKRKQTKQKKQTMHVFTVSGVCNKIVYLCTCLCVFERKSGQTAEADIHSFFYLRHSEYKEIILKLNHLRIYFKNLLFKNCNHVLVKISIGAIFILQNVSRHTGLFSGMKQGQKSVPDSVGICLIFS